MLAVRESWSGPLLAFLRTCSSRGTESSSEGTLHCFRSGSANTDLQEDSLAWGWADRRDRNRCSMACRWVRSLVSESELARSHTSQAHPVSLGTDTPAPAHRLAVLTRCRHTTHRYPRSHSHPTRCSRPQ